MNMSDKLQFVVQRRGGTLESDKLKFVGHDTYLPEC